MVGVLKATGWGMRKWQLCDPSNSSCW